MMMNIVIVVIKNVAARLDYMLTIHVNNSWFINYRI